MDRRRRVSEEPYTNLDLDTAEQLLIAAGKPELSAALRFHAQGVRNLVQGAWGQSFVNSLDTLLKTHIAPLIASQKETQDGIAALGTRFQAIEQDMRALTTRVDELSLRLDRKRSEIDHMNEELRDLRGNYTPVERARLTGILLRMIAEWEAGHPNEAGDDT